MYVIHVINITIVSIEIKKNCIYFSIIKKIFETNVQDLIKVKFIKLYFSMTKLPLFKYII